MNKTGPQGRFLNYSDSFGAFPGSDLSSPRRRGSSSAVEGRRVGCCSPSTLGSSSHSVSRHKGATPPNAKKQLQKINKTWQLVALVELCSMSISSSRSHGLGLCPTNARSMTYLLTLYSSSSLMQRTLFLTYLSFHPTEPEQPIICP